MDKEKLKESFISNSNEGVVETITDDDLPIQRIYSDKDIVIIKKKPNESDKTDDSKEKE